MGIDRAADVLREIELIVLEVANHCYLSKMHPKTLY